MSSRILNGFVRVGPLCAATVGALAFLPAWASEGYLARPSEYPAEAASPSVTFIVESRSGGQNHPNYSETGTWYDGACKSTAPSCTSGIGSRWCYINSTAKTAVFSFTPTMGGTYQVFTTNCNTSNSGNPLIHKVTHAGGTSSVGVCQNSTCGSNAINKWYSLGQYVLIAGTPYSVTLDGSTGSGSLPSGNAGRSDAVKWESVSLEQPPTITQQPSDRSVLPGETATFTVAATGDGTLTYRWQKNDSDLTSGGHYSGCATTTLTVSNCDAADAADYRCVVGNSYGNTPSEAATLTVLVPPTALYPRAILINYDPIIESQGGLRLHQVYGWSDPSAITAGYASDLSAASHNLMNPRVTQTINADVFPVKNSGFRFTDAGFMTCWQSGGCDSTGVDYRAIARDYDLTRRVDAGELDEVLVHGAPYFGYWESTMAGRGAYAINSPPQARIPCSRLFVMMGFNYERGIGEMLHSYGHRSEDIMKRTYGGYWDITQSRNDWERFTHNQTQSGNAACGTVHYPPNAADAYDYGNATFVNSTADDWLNHFPNLTGAQMPVNRDAWGGFDYHRNYMKWWYNHMPHVAGTTTRDGFTRLNNWWAYLQGFNDQPESGGDFAKGGSAPAATPYPALPNGITVNTNDDWFPDINATGRLVWRGFNGLSDQIFSANADGTGFVQITNNAYVNEAPRINASGRVVWQAFDGQDYEIFSADSDGTNLVQITHNTVNDWHPRISATGKIVWDASDASDYEVYSANADGTGIVRITDNNAASGYPRDDVWPQINGSNRVVWFGYSGSSWQIYSANADGTGLVNVSNNTVDNEFPRINDAGRVVWQGWPIAGDNANCEIYSADASGGAVTRITSNAYEDWHPRIGNNGQVVWMSRPTGGKWEVRSASATGGSLATLSPATHHSQYPLINAAGQVVWQGFDGNDWEIYLRSAGTLYQVTDNSYDDRAPCINDREQIAWHAVSAQSSSGDSSEIFAVSRLQIVPGDFDQDDDVDMEDFGLLQRCLGVTNAAADPTCLPADLTADNRVGPPDLALFIGCTSGPGVPGDVNCAN